MQMHELTHMDLELVPACLKFALTASAASFELAI
jgi:hypothetical protein